MDLFDSDIKRLQIKTQKTPAWKTFLTHELGFPIKIEKSNRNIDFSKIYFFPPYLASINARAQKYVHFYLKRPKGLGKSVSVKVLTWLKRTFLEALNKGCVLSLMS